MLRMMVVLGFECGEAWSLVWVCVDMSIHDIYDSALGITIGEGALFEIILLFVVISLLLCVSAVPQPVSFRLLANVVRPVP